MKKIISSIIIAALLGVTVLSLAACGGNTAADPEPVPAPAPEAVSSEAPAPAPAPAADFEMPATFEEWNLGTMKQYLESKGLLGNPDYLSMDLSQNEVDAMGCDGGFLYVDPAGGQVVDTVIFFDPAKEGNADLLALFVENKAIIVGGDVEAGVPVDAIIGGFCLSYGSSLDEAHIGALVAALNELVANYNIQGGFVLD
ncbi:MAG: hypothetical protein HUJ75_08500 [Parasporobacterium sp.]|nr:hypothetical protein [Parasporobacterium sp.]